MRTNAVFVLDKNRAPQSPVHPAAARKLLKLQLATVYRRQPFTILLRTAQDPAQTPRPLRLKITPGSKVSGLAVVDGHRVLWGADLTHRGARISIALKARRAGRRLRRQRKTRYRPARFDNRTRSQGWIPPSLRHRVLTTMTWVRRLREVALIGALSLEHLSFDTQRMQAPEAEGLEYRKGELWGWELRAYVMHKFSYTCAYCDKRDLPLQLGHVVPPSRGGTNRASNLALSCRSCTRKKGTMTAQEFGFPNVQAQARTPLRDATAINVTRSRLRLELEATGLDLEVDTGGRTRYNREQLDLPRAPWIAAACVGTSTPDNLELWTEQPLSIKAIGHGSRRLCLIDKYGFPRSGARRRKRPYGFSAGDIVRVEQKRGARAGTWRGRIAGISMSGQNLIRTTVEGVSFSTSYKNLTLVSRRDGYAYAFNASGER